MKILEEVFAPGDTILVDLVNGELTFSPANLAGAGDRDTVTAS